IFPGIADIIKTSQKLAKEKFDKSHNIVDFPIGSLVALKNSKLSSKLDPKYTAPYTVRHKTRGGTYTLEDNTGSLLPSNFPPSALKAISEIPDEHTYEVEAILNHRNNASGGYEYQVKWRGYEETTWEPADNFHDPKTVSKYWKIKGTLPAGGE